MAAAEEIVLEVAMAMREVIMAQPVAMEAVAEIVLEAAKVLLPVDDGRF